MDGDAIEIRDVGERLVLKEDFSYGHVDFVIEQTHGSVKNVRAL